ncbi:MAG: DsbA family oxidoreductase [Acidimicrobiales bacterium]|jgi:predicted DsbA family dithiol-disulfide isomerase|nr:DsbA family oxidoreductase [Acidimicrobiales bacterium]
MRIDVWSDVICPWCFLGKRRLDTALARLDWGDEVEVRWRAYQLDPTAGPEPGDLRQALERKYGPGAFESMTSRLTALGADDGIDYRFDRALRVNTVDAHRLLAWAWDQGGAPAQGALAERLFLAYFTEGANVADHATLTGLAGEAGLDAAVATSVLAGDGFRSEVTGELHGALERQISGVPAFVIEDRFMIPGAQDVDTFVAVLTQARDRLDPVGPGTPDGEACAVDDPTC